MMPVAMVGRRAELGELREAWAAVVRVAPIVARTAVITGGPGVGKSMLVTAAVEALAPHPVSVFAGTARVHAPAPYDWLASVLNGRETTGLPVPEDALAWLAQHPEARRERYAPGALLRMAVRTVRALVGAGPAVLVADDLHALDPASLNLIVDLAASPDLPVLLLVTSQGPEAAASPDLAGRTLARLSGVRGAVRQHLTGFTAGEVAAVLGQVYPSAEVTPEIVAAVLARTGGNPYQVRELLVTAGSGGLAALAPPAVDPPAAELTSREREVLACLATGMSDKQVARYLGISIRTVNVHVSNLLRKMRLTSRTEAALWAVRQQLLV